MPKTETHTIETRNQLRCAATRSWLNLFDVLGQWRQRARDRRRLGSFDDRMLKDIGLSRADIDGEITTPFWRG